MPIHLPNAPPDALPAAQSQLKSLISSPAAQTGGGRFRVMSEAAGGSALDLSQPHPIFTATTADILSNNLLANAHGDGWRYFILRGDEAIAAAEVRATEVAGLNEGPFVDGTLQAIARAERQVATDGPDYELRLLRIPSLYVVALWLHSPDAELLIPVAPAPRALNANEAYDEIRFTDALRAFAESRAAAAENL